MKKTLITLSTLILASNVACTKAQKAEEAQPKAVEAAEVKNELPEGHPPIDDKHQIAMDDAKLVAAGKLTIAKNLKDKIPKGVVFLTGYSADKKNAGKLIFVKKLPLDKFPIAFELKMADRMTAGLIAPEEIIVRARIDQDGDAISKLPGDLQASSKTVKLGATDVAVVFDTVVSEFKPSQPVE